MNLPLPINEDIWGEIIYMEHNAPDIWFMEADVAPDHSCRGTDGFFAIPKNYSGALLSREALTYGESMGDVTYFDYEHGRLIIEYELLRAGRKISAKRHSRLKLTLDDTLKEIAAVGSEDFPDYFGPMVIPQKTPFGCVTRCKPIQNGVYLVEADTRWLLALSYPLSDDLSVDTLELAQYNQGSRAQAGQCRDAAFFTLQNAIPVIYDLLLWGTRYQPLRNVVRWDALVAALWCNHPQLVALRNAEVDRLVAACEQSTEESEEAIERLICMYEKNRIPAPTTTDTDFLCLS